MVTATISAPQTAAPDFRSLPEPGREASNRWPHVIGLGLTENPVLTILTHNTREERGIQYKGNFFQILQFIKAIG